YGDVAVIGGAAGMTGAALLAATSALYGGAGRVLVALLDGASMMVDTAQPELMFRGIDDLDLAHTTVVCGCGGGDAIRSHLSKIMSVAPRVVIDADAINAIAIEAQLQHLLKARHARRRATVLTPHPLEAARLLGVSTADVQADRIGAARQLCERFACTVVLKGSGTVIAAPGEVPAINATGNARLATAGTGDVLAGMIAAELARGADAFSAACGAVYRHGASADHWSGMRGLVARDLARRCTRQ
ncbi:MAG: NAD(P)H-hydrate dehydratase, partial [Reyranella sp.]|nr:NAD(P)H-hydrate dehydratase [Reyranella sp.]